MTKPYTTLDLSHLAGPACIAVGEKMFFLDDMAVAQLLLDRILFVSGQPYRMSGQYAGAAGEKDTIGLVVNCNDLFWWGCADAEDVSPDELQGLYDAWVEGRVSRWVCLHRGMRPQAVIEQDWRESGLWDEALEALPARDLEETG